MLTDKGRRRDLAWEVLSPLLACRPARKYDGALRKDARFKGAKGEELETKQLQRSFCAALQEGLVRVEVERVYGAAAGLHRPRVQGENEGDEGLEAQLRVRFPGLKSALVFKTRPGAEPDVLRQVANALAWEIARGPFPVLADSQSIGLGSGRTVHHVANALARLQIRHVRAVTLRPLTGHVFAVNAAAPEEQDADHNLQLFTAAFPDALSVDVRYLHTPITHGEGAGTARALAECWFSPSNFSSNVPDHALVGMGTLTEGHRFWDVAEEDPQRDPGCLKPLVADLTTLRAHVVEIMKLYPTWCPIGDICNRLVYTPYFESPEKDKTDLDPDVRDLVEPLIQMKDSLNRRLLTITKTQLQRFRGRVIACTGGSKPKAHLLAYLLDYMPKMIDTIAVDEATAKHIVELETRFAERDDTKAANSSAK